MKNPKKLISQISILFIPIILSSCATLTFNKEQISFDDMPKIIGLSEISKDELEANGLSEQKTIPLKFSKPQNSKLSYREISKIYAQIDNNYGLATKFTRNITQIFKDSSSIGWLLENISRLENKKNENIIIKFEMTDRGEITKILSGKGKSSDGNIEILEWTRTAIFPSEPVKIGDKWHYTEKIKTKISSFLVNKSSDTPEELNAISTFRGYAKFRGSICAVLETRAFQQKKEIFSTPIKNLCLNISSHILEKMYFDINRGLIVAKIAEIDIFSVSEDESFADQSKAKTITILIEE